MIVMPGLAPGIHAFICAGTVETWMAGTSPAMTEGYALSAELAQKWRRGNGLAGRLRTGNSAARPDARRFELAAGGEDVAAAGRAHRRRIAGVEHDVGERLDRRVRRAFVRRAGP